MPAAKAAMAAHRQGQFWAYHDKLFANQRALTSDNLVRWAEELGLDVDQFRKDMADPALEQVIRRQQQAVVSLGARGTPGFFINGEPLRGAQPYEKFEEVVTRQLDAARKLVEQGTPREQAWLQVARTSHPQGARFVQVIAGVAK